MKLKFAALTIGALFATATGSHADTINYPANPGSPIAAWGPGSAANVTYGEIFTAPQPVLDDFSLTVSSQFPFPFVAQVYQWNGTGTVGLVTLY